MRGSILALRRWILTRLYRHIHLKAYIITQSLWIEYEQATQECKCSFFSNLKHVFSLLQPLCITATLTSASCWMVSGLAAGVLARRPGPCRAAGGQQRWARRAECLTRVQGSGNMLLHMLSNAEPLFSFKKGVKKKRKNCRLCSLPWKKWKHCVGFYFTHIGLMKC